MKSSNKLLPLFMLLIAVIVLTACGGSATETSKSETKPQETNDHQHHDHQHQDNQEEGDKQVDAIDHIHGLGFDGLGERLLVAEHEGLLQYANKAWTKPAGPLHDYMGFQVVDDGFYSSGHPAPGSMLKNPLGVVKSTDFGKTIETLNLSGLTDFHTFGVGYKNHVMYGYNEMPNAILPEKAVYVSVDRAKTWEKVGLSGFRGVPVFIAAHPTDAKIAAFLNERGQLFATNDGGKTVTSIYQGVAQNMLFSSDGEQLFVAEPNSTALKKIRVQNWQLSSLTVPFPANLSAPVIYMASHPLQTNTLAIADVRLNIYLTENDGKSWTSIMTNGVPQK